MLVPCPTGGRTSSELAPELSALAVETNIFALCEIENGTQHTVNHRPRALPVRDYLLKQGRFRHLQEEQIRQIQKEEDDEWARLLAGNPRFEEGDSHSRTGA